MVVLGIEVEIQSDVEARWEGMEVEVNSGGDEWSRRLCRNGGAGLV